LSRFLQVNKCNAGGTALLDWKVYVILLLATLPKSTLVILMFPSLPPTTYHSLLSWRIYGWDLLDVEHEAWRIVTCT
jgi:hypothetical protein